MTGPSLIKADGRVVLRATMGGPATAGERLVLEPRTGRLVRLTDTRLWWQHFGHAADRLAAGDEVECAHIGHGGWRLTTPGDTAARSTPPPG